MDEEIINDNMIELVSIMTQIEPALLASFLESMLTPREKNDIAKRWALVKLLDRGMTQRKIAEELQISLCKITRGSREYRRDNSPVRQFLQIGKKLNLLD
jgi:TrpR family trp operon transcriptional repressor